MTKWKFGPAEPYWMEDLVLDDAWHYIIDLDDSQQELHRILVFLGLLEVIDYGAYYENTYQIRIKV